MSTETESTLNQDKSKVLQDRVDSYKKLHSVRWRNRRAMTWLAAAGAIILFPGLMFFNHEMKEISAAFYTFCTAIVGSYLGFRTYEDNKGKE